MKIIKKILECILMELLILIVFPIMLVALKSDIDIITIIYGTLIISIIALFVFFLVNRESKIEKREVKRHEKSEVIKGKIRKKMEGIKKVRCEKIETENKERKNFMMENEKEIIKGKIYENLSILYKKTIKFYVIASIISIVSLIYVAMEEEELFWQFFCVSRFFVDNVNLDGVSLF